MERKPAPKQGKKRNPAGVTLAKPIPLRLGKENRAVAEKLAGKDKTLSAHAYECYIAGRDVLFPDLSSSPRAKRGIARGGAANHRAAASLSK